MNSRIFWELNEAYQLGVCNQVDEEVLTEEELVGIQEWVEALIEEGYDLDEYTDDELYEAYLEDLDEAKVDSSLTPLQKIRKRNKEGNLVMSAGDQTSERRSYHKAGRGEKKEKGDKYDVESTVGKDKWTREAEVKKRYGSHYDETGRRERNIRAIKSQEKVGGAKGLPEEVDLYDIVSEYLVSEGFCESYEDADVIMANMSEEWRESIVEEVLDERNRGEIGMSDREVSRRRNLGLRDPKMSSSSLGDGGPQKSIQKYHNIKGKTRSAEHKASRNTRGDLGRVGGTGSKSRYQANKDHEDGYPSIVSRGSGPF